MAAVGDRLRITRGDHAGRTGVVTKINGPKTVKIRLDAGFTLENVKLASTEDEGAALLAKDASDHLLGRGKYDG